MQAGGVIAGIDYGSKLAGTTVFALSTGNKILIENSEKGKDADAFLLNCIERHQPELIMLDAPLSLPGIYRGLAGCKDYFYRECDRQLGAMSPMFLGGLTARAIKLAAEPSLQNPIILECYPKQVVKITGLDSFYEKPKGAISNAFRLGLMDEFGTNLSIPEIQTWHEADALLCLLSAYRHQMGKAQAFGNEVEGFIWA